jgi:hypothetical protein
MSWTGKWTFNDGFMSMCTTSDNTTLQGMYGTYYFQGTFSADGVTVSGKWWDTQIWYEYPAQVAATKTTKCCTQNKGDLTISRLTDDLVEIRMAYDDKSIQFFKFGPRILARYDDATPTSFSCFANDPNTGKSIAGNWASKLGRTSTPNWGICIDGDGNLKGSYEFTAINGYGNNVTVRGYSDGYCYYNNAFCWIDYYEDFAGSKSVGGYVLALGFADYMYGVYDFGTGEVYTRLTDSGSECERNSNLKYKYYLNDSTRFSWSVVPLAMILLALLF